jgi:hypothetical protein
MKNNGPTTGSTLRAASGATVTHDVPRDFVARNAALTSFAACPAPGAGTGRFTKFGWLSAGCACYHPAKLVSAALATEDKYDYTDYFCPRLCYCDC